LTEAAPSGVILRLYGLVSRLAAPFAEGHLRKRLARGKEIPERWREKLGEASASRPEGTLVWMHAVGLGEVLALRGLIDEMARTRPDLHFLVTSSARASGEVFDRNRPPRTQHQFLPLDFAPAIGRFLDHWRPDLSVWAEQDLWPGLVVETHRRGIPLAMVNARMSARAFRSRKRARRLYGDLYIRFAMVGAQDEATAAHLKALCPGLDVTVMGSLKAACSPLSDAAEERAALSSRLSGRWLWLAAPTHAADEAIALAAQSVRFANDPASLLILAPRVPSRRDEIISACAAHGFGVAVRSEGEVPGQDDAVWLADTFGEMGLWYRMCPVSLIGGSFGETGGHNPWEAAGLGSAILHGPVTTNFLADYAALDGAGAAREVADTVQLLEALDAPDLAALAGMAREVQEKARVGARIAADRLLDLIGPR
jgi:3-deoxy-D-manno-octulosonic-acid transferase